MNLTKNILFINVVVILLLHSFIPHKHHNEMAYEEHYIVHENANGIIDLIGLVLHEGSSENLETIILSKENVMKDIERSYLDFFAITAYLAIKINVKYSGCFIKIRPQELSNNFHIIFSGLRGPPIYDYYS